jgi:hypothetical protein
VRELMRGFESFFMRGRLPAAKGMQDRYEAAGTGL